MEGQRVFRTLPCPTSVQILNVALAPLLHALFLLWGENTIKNVKKHKAVAQLKLDPG